MTPHPFLKLWQQVKPERELHRLFDVKVVKMNDTISRETRTGNTLYQELSFQDSEAIADVDEGADITGKQL